MSRIVFFCIPAHGHTNPTLGVVKALVNRGHSVWYYSYEMMREKIEQTGAVFVACDAYDAERKLSPKDSARVGKDLAFSTRLLVDTTLALDEAVLEDMRKRNPDCIVADSMAVWGKAVALKLGIPFVSSTTTFAFNRHSASLMKQSFGEILGMILSMPKIGKDIKRLQARGYPINNILDIIRNDEKTHTIVYTSPEFQPFSETFSPDHYAFIGPSLREIQQPVKKTREKLIYISMGTVNNDMMPLYRSCIQALGDTGHQIILSVGNQVPLDAFGKPPENVQVSQWVDQLAVLEKADLFLTHCGMNSVSEALYYGVPLLMLPKTKEQEAVAARVQQLGAGILLKNTRKQTLKAAAELILQEPAYRDQAKEIAEGFRRCRGPEGGADKILTVCKSPATE